VTCRPDTQAPTREITVSKAQSHADPICIIEDHARLKVDAAHIE